MTFHSRLYISTSTKIIRTYHVGTGNVCKNLVIFQLGETIDWSKECLLWVSVESCISQINTKFGLLVALEEKSGSYSLRIHCLTMMIQKSLLHSTSLYYLPEERHSVILFSLFILHDTADEMERAVICFIILGVISGELLNLYTAERSKYSFTYFSNSKTCRYFSLGDKMWLQMSLFNEDSMSFLPFLISMHRCIS